MNGDPTHGVGKFAAQGAARRKATALLRLMGSAISFDNPGIQDTWSVMFRAVHRSIANVSIAPIAADDECLFAKTPTAPLLSERIWTFWFSHVW